MLNLSEADQRKIQIAKDWQALIPLLAISFKTTVDVSLMQEANLDTPSGRQQWNRALQMYADHLGLAYRYDTLPE